MTIKDVKQKLLQKIEDVIPSADLELVKKACDIAEKYHGTQLRASGHPYFHHPIEVAYIVADMMRLDVTTIIAAILHDTIEDTNLKLEEVEKEFDEEVAKLVDGVTKLTKIESQPDYVRQAESFKKLLFAISDDVRVLLIKLADRLHNMRTIKYISSHEKRGRIARETMDIYAPLAERTGMQKIKLELQDLAFGELHPAVRQSIVSRLEYLHKTEGLIVDNVIREIEELLSHNEIKARVFGREKAPCSIWFKMQRKKVSFEQLSDIIAFRVVVDNIGDCYKALGIIHTNYQVIPGEFMDYISIPKDNGYKSIHTVIIGPSKQRVEIQIRTEEMHEIAEYGVAAHWLYKQGSEFKKEGRSLKWIRDLLNVIENSTESKDIIENAKMQMYYEQVFCFTPEGKLIVLPRGATAVDFAYAVHSKVGNSCIGSRVNGRNVPLQTLLDNGDQVEIITDELESPNPLWENFVITAKAKSEIKRFIRSQQKSEYIELGKAMLHKEFQDIKQEFIEKEIEKIIPIFNKKSMEDLFASVGEGSIARSDVIKAIYPESYNNYTMNGIKKTLSIFSFRKNSNKENDISKKLNIIGLVPGMAVHYSKCCCPIFGDQIVGIITSGKGVDIHTKDCKEISMHNGSSTILEVHWDNQKYGINAINSRIKVTIVHSIGSLAAVCESIAKENSNILNLKIISRSQDFFDILIDIQAPNILSINNITISLKSQKIVNSVSKVY